MTTLLALGCLGLAAWALWERGARKSQERTVDIWQAQVTAANDEVRRLECELARARKNDTPKDPKTGRFCKPEEVH